MLPRHGHLAHQNFAANCVSLLGSVRKNSRQVLTKTVSTEGFTSNGCRRFCSCESGGVCYEARRFVLSRSWQRSMHIGRRSRCEEAKGMWGLLCRTKKSMFVSH